MATAIKPDLNTRRPGEQRHAGPKKPMAQPAAGAVAQSARQEPSISFGPIWIRTVILTTLAMIVGVGVPMWFLTGEIWDGIGLGLFTAVWGGPGFGTMLAGALWTLRLERAAAVH